MGLGCGPVPGKEKKEMSEKLVEMEAQLDEIAEDLSTKRMALLQLKKEVKELEGHQIAANRRLISLLHEMTTERDRG